MKLLTAFIQPEKLNDVKRALFAAEIRKMSVTNCLGCGQQGGFPEHYRGQELEVNLIKKVRIEIALNNDFVQPAIDAIIKGAKTGNIGDGKILISNLDECIRIRTEESGNEAIG